MSVIFKKKWTKWLTINLIIVNMGLIIAIIFFYKEKEHFKSLVPFLSPGERIPRIDFLDERKQVVSYKQFLKRPTIIFIFERPCSTCTKNIVFWNKLYELSKNKINSLGIIQDISEMLEIARRKIIPFKLLSPAKYNEFKKSWRVYLNLSQTILIYRNRVDLIKIGDIDEASIKEIWDRIKRLETQ